MPNAEPTIGEMLDELVDANRARYERDGNVVSNTEAFDREFRTRKLRDEENRPGAIRIAWENLTGHAPKRSTPPAKTAVTQSAYTGGLAATLIADGSWTPKQIVEMLAEADGITEELAARIYAEALGEGYAEIEQRTHRREAREKQAAGVKPSVPHLERITIATPTPPDDDLDDDAIWNQEPA